MTDEVARYLNKADHALVVAHDLVEQGHVGAIKAFLGLK